MASEFEAPDVLGGLQDAGELALQIMQAIIDGDIPDLASDDDEFEIVSACKMFVADLVRYESACMGPRLPGGSRDMGPSQEQRS